MLSVKTAQVVRGRDSGLARKRWRRALSVTLLAAHMKTLARHAESARVESGPLPGADDERTSTNRQTWANIVNVYVGLGLLSTPYALAECGWSGLIGLGAAFLACLYTGQTIVHAFNAAADKDGSCSYPGVGAAAFGGLGEWAVIVFVFLEFFGGLAMCIVFYWTNLDHLLPAGWDEFTIAMVSVVVVLPTVWVKRFSDLSFISLLGFGSSLLITAVTTGVAAYGEAEEHAAVAHETSSTFFTSLQRFGVGLGIFVTSMAGQAALPTLYEKMAHRRSYPKVLGGAYATMAVIYTLMSVSGFIRYGNSTAVLITTSLDEAPGGVLAKIAVGLVVVSCFCTIAPICAVLSSQIEGKAGIRSGNAVRLLRTGIMVAAVTLAWVARNNLGNLASLIGGIGSIMTSLVLPTAFYLKLCWDSLHLTETTLNVVLLALSGCLQVFVIGSNVRDLLT